MTREGGGLARHTLHHVAIAAHGIHTIVEDRVLGPIEALPKPARRQSHAYAGAAPLTEGTRGGFHAGGQSILGVPRARAIELSKALDVVESDSCGAPTVWESDRSHAGKMQRGVKQHRGVAVREHEAIS